jgi:hypothetical protein
VELSDEVMAGIKIAAKRVSCYGSLVLRFNGGDTIDIEVTDRIRLQERGTSKAGEVVKEKKIVVIRQERQG